ncbi:DUF202 domain-containing protein [Celerinatantimonas diazotrophica]|uniref:Uncharacterized protein DUF202 n=1 Tax=Celerinatantimonas diazotrophica TaxID=412034 RepID=A0A4R1K4C2_9GAMM|nr:DUF202 domain-containing protein [Celerinatantimonas diazotrophica]TCK58968.1 uncharacterized protein DUF202 [Celerinatantimonas diazotrophica]CAG9297603.1 hypothetical protein CEDIAZO_02791 [Celerinatantimonas diazotrophica]
METPGLQYERTLLSWWRTLLSTVVIVAAISRVGLVSSNVFLVISAIALLFGTVFMSIMTTIELSRNIKNSMSLIYGPFAFNKKILSSILILSAVFYIFYLINKLFLIY